MEKFEISQGYHGGHGGYEEMEGGDREGRGPGGGHAYDALLSALNKIEFYSTPRTEVLSAISPLGHRNSFGTLGKNNNHLRW